MSDKPNRLVQFVTEWGKADDGQMVCAALGVGKSIEEIHDATLVIFCASFLWMWVASTDYWLLTAKH